ncbi:MAG TPA: BON domain-containing protein, partial [Terriglobales bacterium]
QNALVVRELVHAERPAASWNDRSALEQLMDDLEKEAQIRLYEQRRTRLLDLASELEAGSVRHRFEARAASLSALRTGAVRELRIAAALPDQRKELPGPEPSQWLHWACNLLEENDASVFTELRTDFPALEEFAVEMEESYWVPGQAGQGSTRSAAPAARMPQEPASDWNDWKSPSSPPGSEYRKPPHNVRAPSDAAVQSGGYGTAVALGYDTQSSAAPNLAETHWPAEETAPWQRAEAMELDDEPAVETIAPPLKVCEKCGKNYSNGFHACVVDQAVLQIAAQTAPAVVDHGYPSNGKNGNGNGNGAVAISAAELSSMLETETVPTRGAAATESTETPAVDSSRETAETEFHRLRAIMEQRSQESLGDEEESVGWNFGRKQIIGIVVAVCVVLGVAIYAVAHYYSEKNVEAAAALAAAAAKVPVVPPDADLQKEIEQKLTTLKNSTIDVAVQGGVVTLSGKSSSEDESIQAEDLSLQTSGVKVVRDRIQVEGHGGSNGKPRAGKTGQH